ncbi:phage tail tape measure protein [Gimesia fumaroli]|uniref:Phage-related minor tail protein n=1 Tax=Gimesia fumaroli TaxID=2527976 RepID=A0A518I8T5_9PLAN|nr:phage tail tape measure protein [Gimesia fumaroli]QDV49528.1 Phage-related minor tail protein [Gimesia fumaroli]
MSSTIHALRAIVSTKTAGFVRGMKAAISATRQLRQQWVSAAKDTASAGARIVMVIGAIGLISATTFGKFEQTMTRVGAVTRTLGTRDFKTLEDAARDAGRTTVFTATQSAEAMEKLGLAGLKVNEITTALKPTLQLASAAQLSIAQAADISAKTMRAYGAEAKDLTHINDVLAATFTSSNTDLTQLAEALKMVGPVANSVNVNLRDTVSILGIMGDAGFQASLAGTALRNAFIHIANPSAKANKLLKDMNINTAGPLIDTLSQLEMALRSVANPQERLAIVSEIFGVRAGPAMIAVLDRGTDAVREFAKGINEAAGLTAKMEEANLSTQVGQIELLKSSISDLVIEIGEHQSDALVGATNEFKKYLEEHKPGIVEKVSNATIALVNGLKNLVQWLNEASPGLKEAWDMMAGFMGPIRDFIAAHPGILATMLALKAVSALGVTQAITSLGTALAGSVSGLAAFISWVRAASVSTKLFSASIVTLQTVLGIGVVVALAMALKKVASWAQKNFGVFNPLIAIYREFMSVVCDVSGIIRRELGPVFSDISNIVSNELMPVLKEIWVETKNELLPAFADMARTLAKALFPEFKKFAQIIRDEVIPMVRTMIPSFKNILKAIGDLVVAGFKVATPVMRELVKFGFWALHGAIVAVTEVVGFAVDALAGMANLIDSTLTPVLKALGIEMDKNQEKLEKEIKTLKERNDLEKDRTKAVKDAVEDAKKIADAAINMGTGEDPKKQLIALLNARQRIEQIAAEAHDAFKKGLIEEEDLNRVKELEGTLSQVAKRFFEAKATFDQSRSLQDNAPFTPVDQAAEGQSAIQAEVDPNEIANILRDSRRDAKDRELPGFSKVRDFIDLGPTQEQFNQFLGTIEGMTPQIRQDISELYDYILQDGEFTASEMDYLATRTASRLQRQSQFEDERERKQEVYKQSLQQLGTMMQGLKGKIPNRVLESLAGSFNSLREQFRDGKIGIDEYKSGVSALTKETQKAADAAKAAAAAEERKRLIQGKFSAKDFKTALEDRIIAFRQQQFSSAVERSFNAMFGFNQQMGLATEGFGQLRSGLDGFGDKLGSAFGGVSQVSDQAIQTLRSFFSSTQGQAANLRNQITQLEQNMTLVDTYSARKRIQDMIDNLLNQLDAVTQAPPPTFSGVTGNNFFKDPGLQSVNTQNNRNEINLPNVTRISQIEVDELYDRLDQVAQRRGGRFSG